MSLPKPERVLIERNMALQCQFRRYLWWTFIVARRSYPLNLYPWRWQQYRGPCGEEDPEIWKQLIWRRTETSSFLLQETVKVFGEDGHCSSCKAQPHLCLQSALTGTKTPCKSCKFWFLLWKMKTSKLFAGKYSILVLTFGFEFEATTIPIKSRISIGIEFLYKILCMFSANNPT